MLGVGIIPSVFIDFVLFVIPESPIWLVIRDIIEEARSILSNTNSSDKKVEERLKEIQQTASGMAKSEKYKFKALRKEIMSETSFGSADATTCLFGLSLTLAILRDGKVNHSGNSSKCGILLSGIGPICWVVSSKIFPLRLRAQASALIAK